MFDGADVMTRAYSDVVTLSIDVTIDTGGTAPLVLPTIERAVDVVMLAQAVSVLVPTPPRDSTRLADAMSALRARYPGIDVVVSAENVGATTAALSAVPGPPVRLVPQGQAARSSASQRAADVLAQVTRPYVFYADAAVVSVADAGDAADRLDVLHLDVLLQQLVQHRLDVVAGEVLEDDASTTGYDMAGVFDVLQSGAARLRRRHHREVGACLQVDIVAPSFMASANAVRAVGWDPRIAALERLDFFLSAARQNLVVASCPFSTLLAGHRSLDDGGARDDGGAVDTIRSGVVDGEIVMLTGPLSSQSAGLLDGLSVDEHIRAVVAVMAKHELAMLQSFAVAYVYDPEAAVSVVKREEDKGTTWTMPAEHVLNSGGAGMRVVPVV